VSDGEGAPLGAARLPGGLTLRGLIPNAITASALCSGLTGVRFAVTAASGGTIGAVPVAARILPFDDWQKAVLAVMLAGFLDGIDGRIARLLKAQSRFGAELDSLADSISFGVAPALILFLWSLQDSPRLGWFAALAFALSAVLRLARFNARIDMPDQPHKSAGYLTGVPAPLGAVLGLLPMYLWFATGDDRWRMPVIVGPWLVLNAFLMISSVATFSWSALRPRRRVRLEVIGLVALVFAALISEPWLTLVGLSVVYVALIPLGMFSYARVRRLRDRRGPAPVPDSDRA